MNRARLGRSVGRLSAAPTVVAPEGENVRPILSGGLLSRAKNSGKKTPGGRTMLIGYVSDERYSALPDVLVELIDARGSWEARSRASGAIHCDCPEGDY